MLIWIPKSPDFGDESLSISPDVGRRRTPERGIFFENMARIPKRKKI